MKRRSDKNSTTAAVAGFQGAIEPIPMPEGVTLRSAEEHIIWGQFTRARAREDWRDMDLLLLAKVVRMEADIRKHQTVLDHTGALIETDIPHLKHLQSGYEQKPGRSILFSH